MDYEVQNSDLRGIRILLYERDRLAAESIAGDLRLTGARVVIAGSFDEMVEILTKTESDVTVASLELVDERCIELIKDYKVRYPGSLFYVLADQEYDSVETTQEDVRLIVDDYIRKPVDSARFASMIQTGLGMPDDSEKSLTVVDPIVSRVKPYFLLRSPAMKRALAHLPRIAASGQTVMITGETGTGKELVARVIHVMSRRSSGPFIPVNCGAVPESLIEGELFGHEKGAFTGAVRTRRGKFETADKGTIFLDEIGDMPLNLQVRLLRVLEEGGISRIGAESSVPVDVRVIGASNADLQKAVKDGLFREDLYYRLNVLRIHLPPLRERTEDIPLLAVHFLERAFAELSWPQPYPELSPETIYMLERYRWRGNVRELRNVMTRVATLLPQGIRRIFPFHVVSHLEEDGRLPSGQPEGTRGGGVFIPLGTDMKQVEDIIIGETLRHTGGNRTRAAAMLGISVRNLRRKLNK